MHIHNIKYLEERRRRLRTDGTPAEAALWSSIKNKKIAGLKFRRQHSVGNFILDFYCPAIKLCIELDGDHHYTPEGMLSDERRTVYLNSKNITVIRFENRLVFEDLDFIIESILNYYFSTTPSPPAAEPPLLDQEGST
jgi:very-short-patch-repair endonuclease